ncbi:TetR/AcrR family transcriptional regulator [Nesterenkonia xinjiangensis]|uniref:AcrR family transcriptional regulator n=1 Tax=Nesterenkonia xinjiangensis TaxID=225327 RepID=A0A7Z0GKM8_9MICC|nr:TetR/AcrR family transcriptional regulator [Nesterenkonia xinjiangensis]NYJ77697.1 AcrR family transcriptional regulator [Nesterenkonia xinjiangensis]
MRRSPDQGPRPSARERILDAAADVMRTDGLARATTKRIAGAASCSEALLYKHFPEKQDIFLAVLQERSPRLPPLGEAAGAGEVRDILTAITARLIAFYALNFPMAAALFGDHALLTAHRAALETRGAGPQAPSSSITAHLQEEIARGRVSATCDADATARLLTGAALHEGFLAGYTGTPVDDAEGLAARLVDSLAL